jgi:hypothetical protein
MPSKRIIPRALFEPFSGLQASDLLESETLLSLIRNETPYAIEEAFKSRKTFATIFEVNTTGYYLDVPKIYWIAALEECIKLNITEDHFEECIKLTKLIENIKKASKKPIKVNQNGERVNGDTTSHK